LLTPPEKASNEDDGLLTASEVARLEMDADWVILSACNTAAADGSPGAEALSGLASAFLYAGARSLLVSHWYVNSEGAVRLITGAFAELLRDPRNRQSRSPAPQYRGSHPRGRWPGPSVILGAVRHRW